MCYAAILISSLHMNNNNNTTREKFRKVQNSRLSFVGHAFKGSTLSN